MAAGARQRLDELLLARATEGLSSAEARELTALLTAEPDVDASGYERAAAAVCLAVLGRRNTMPSGLRERLERHAQEFVAKAHTDR